ncbi:MAG: sulfatase [Pseudomonadota bacterium]|nr:sulfatase [Pseudomonadota bacterium]
MRPPFRPLARFGLLTGAAAGAVEVALRASPRQGLGAAEVATWLGASIGLGTAFGLALAVAAWIVGRRSYGLVVAGILGLHAAVNYRFEWVLNEFVRDPRVWGGIGASLLLSLLVGLGSDRWLRRVLGASGGPLRPLLRGAVLAGVGLAFLRANGPAGHVGPRPSVLVISLDTARFDRLSPYGHAIDTPILERLAREGVVFDQAIAAAPITEPSHLSLFTGRPPLATGVVSNGTNLGDRPELLWRALQAEGFLTAGFVAGFPLHGKYGWGQGMNVYDDDFGGLAGLQMLGLVKAFNQVALKEHALRERPAARVLARAVPWIEAHRDTQFFAFVHLYDAHGPYDQPTNAALGPAPTDGPALALPPYWPAPDRRITSPDWLARAYDNELVAVDAAVGQLLAALGPRLDETIVMVTADHGESLTEHDYLFDHGDNLYDPSLRVPWIVRFPPTATAGVRVPCQVGGVDLTPTVLDLVGLVDNVPREGVSRVSELRGGPCRELPVYASTVAGRLVADPPTDHALRGQGRKLILHQGGATGAGGAELYDLVADPGESVNLAPNEVSDAMSALLEARVAGATVTSPELDTETAAMLKALGYTDGSTE